MPSLNAQILYMIRPCKNKSCFHAPNGAMVHQPLFFFFPFLLSRSPFPTNQGICDIGVEGVGAPVWFHTLVATTVSPQRKSHSATLACYWRAPGLRTTRIEI